MAMIFWKKHFLVFFFYYCAIIPFCRSQSLRCKGEDNQDVDWYVLYKIPKMTGSDDEFVQTGEAYLYISSDSISSEWTMSKKSINARDSIPGNTLNSFYNESVNKDSFWILYNDQPPKHPPKEDDGHAKGALLVNDFEGFWLIHSVPHFPPDPSGKTGPNESTTRRRAGSYSYPMSGRENGQSFLCITMEADQFDLIGRQLQINEIFAYRTNLPERLAEKYPSLMDAAQGRFVKKPPFNSVSTFTSMGGENFVSFAKSNKWNKDLYEDFVAPQLMENLYAETWLNGPDRLPSECHRHMKVMNVKSIRMDAAGVRFWNSHDHSKWAISFGEPNKNYVCIGDINRASTQYKRGGGTVCFSNQDIWHNYNRLVKDIEPCREDTVWTNIGSWFG